MKHLTQGKEKGRKDEERISLRSKIRNQKIKKQ